MIEQLLYLLRVIDEEHKHEYYAHCVKYSKKLKSLLIADGDYLGHLLSQFVTRESEAAFTQRKNVTKLPTRAMFFKIMSPFFKAHRNDSIIKKLDPLANLEQLEQDFYGDDSVDKYIVSELIVQFFCDPNAFLLIDWENFDENENKADPYPVFIPSEQAIDYRYEKNVLQFLIKETKQGFTMYTNGDTLRLKVVEKVGNAIKLKDFLEKEHEELPEVGTVFVNGTNYYAFEKYEPNLEAIQARQIGYLRDAETYSKTFRSPVHAAIPRMEKVIKVSSELDIVMAYMAHPQKIQRVRQCQGAKDEKGVTQACISGKNREGGACGGCKGSGFQLVATSAQEVLYVPFPDDPEDHIDIDEIVRYVGPDVALPQFQDEYISRQEEKAMSDVFASSVFSVKATTQTATEVTINYEAIYDQLFPYCEFVSGLWEWIIEKNAEITDTKVSDVFHAFPADLKLESLSDLVTMLTESEGAPVAVRRSLQKQIIEKRFRDDENERKRNLVKMDHEPFVGSSETELQFYISNDLAPKKDQVLKANFDLVFKLAEERNEQFYDMTFEKRRLELDAIVNEMMIDMGLLIETELGEGITDVEAEAKAKLKGTVGGVRGIIEINQAVAEGTMSEASAEALLVDLFGISEERAAILIEKGNRGQGVPTISPVE